jgi:hypothetical protein
MRERVAIDEQPHGRHAGAHGGTAAADSFRVTAASPDFLFPSRTWLKTINLEDFAYRESREPRAGK